MVAEDKVNGYMHTPKCYLISPKWRNANSPTISKVCIKLQLRILNNRKTISLQQWVTIT